MSGRYGFLVVVVAVALAVVGVLLALPDKAGAQRVGYCPSNGIVPGSVSVVSTNNGVGQVSGHVVEFQLCGGIGGAAVAEGSRPPLKIGLLWETGAEQKSWRDDNRFILNSPEAAGITLRSTDSGKLWPATGELTETADPDRSYHVYSTNSSRGYGYRNFQGVTVDFGPADLLDSLAASGDLPLTLQFNVPFSAGMSNPENIGAYSWLIVLYHDFINSCEAKFASATSTIVPAYIPGELQVFPKFGGPGTTITVSGNGFPASARVDIVKFGPGRHWTESDGLDITPSHQVYTNYLGALEFDLIIPGVKAGEFPIQVQLGEKTVNAEFTVTPSSISGPVWPTVWDIKRDMGDNFAAAFHYNTNTCRWSFYDPELPDESDLHFLARGETYWILVKEPANAVLGNETRNLTCTPGGNCWNLIVW